MVSNILLAVFSAITGWAFLRLLGGERERGMQQLESDRAVAAANAALLPAAAPAAPTTPPSKSAAKPPAKPKSGVAKAVR